jgi:putative tryptophan/tyrosine transport system substrate-binding protein
VLRWRSIVIASALVLAGAVMPLRAQTADRVVRVGVLQFGELTAERRQYYEGFRQELRSLGWEDGRNLVLDARYADGKPDRLKELASSLTAIKPNVIVALGGVTTVRTLQEATATIPIVMVATAVDPVQAGFIESLARPGRNITGSVSLGPALNGKRLELLKEVAPHAKRIGIVLNPAIWSIEDLRSSASALGVTLVPIEVRQPEDLSSFPHQIRTQGAEALVVLTDPGVLESHLAETLSRVQQTRLPAIFPWPSYAAAGGLMSYSASLGDLYRRAALTVDRILKGASPVELPVEQPVKFELVINLKTVRALGIEIPAGLLARADEVIE